MENEPELIRDQMQETRNSLTEKLEALESKVSSTVQDATEAVTDTVEAVTDSVTETVDVVKDTVGETVETVQESVKSAFDLTGHAERHPWLVLLGSVAVGYVGCRLLKAATTSPAHRAHHEPTGAFGATSEPRRTNGTHGGSHKPKKATSEEGFFSSLANSFQSELGTLKGLGVGAVAGVVRHLVSQSLDGPVRDWVNDVTNKVTQSSSDSESSEVTSAPTREPSHRGKSMSVQRETMPRN